MVINSLADLNRLVAESAFCPEPPLSERKPDQEIHQSTAWRWVPRQSCKACVGLISWGCKRCIQAHWEPADFATDPAASYALRQKMRADGYYFKSFDTESLSGVRGISASIINFADSPDFEATHESELVAFALAALRALNVEFELAENWDKN